MCQAPPRETMKIIQVAAHAATTVTATALGGDLLGLSDVPWAPLAPDGAVERSAGAGGGQGATGSVRSGGAALGGVVRKGGKPQATCSVSVAAGGVRRQASGQRRNIRTFISLGKSIKLIDIKDDGYTWAETLAIFPLRISPSAARAIYRRRDDYKGRASAAEDLAAQRLRRSYFESVSQGL